MEPKYISMIVEGYNIPDIAYFFNYITTLEERTSKRSSSQFCKPKNTNPSYKDFRSLFPSPFRLQMASIRAA